MTNASIQHEGPELASTPTTLSRAESKSVVALDLKEKHIVFVLPEDATMSGANTALPGGALIQGNFNGSLICERGAIVIAPGAKFSGYAEADEIYIAGEVASMGKKLSSMMGRLVISTSENAIVHADLTSRMFNFHNSRNLRGAIRSLA